VLLAADATPAWFGRRLTVEGRAALSRQDSGPGRTTVSSPMDSCLLLQFVI